MDNRAPQVLTVAILFAALTWITVALRCYVRGRMLHNFGPDDWLMLATQILFSAYLGCQLGGVAYGTGRHRWDLTTEQNQTALHFWFFCELFYIATTSLLKVAIGVFLLRIAVNKFHRKLLRILIVGTSLFGTAYFLIGLFQCSPISVWWMLGPSNKRCINPKIITGSTYCASVINSLADWTFGILPIFIVWDLEMAKRQKILVAGILAFAAIGSTATIIRIPSIAGLEKTQDFLWDTVDIAIWSTVEPGVGIAAGCVATLRPLMHAIFKSEAWRSHVSARLSGRHRANENKSPSNAYAGIGAKTSQLSSLSHSAGGKSPLPFPRSTSQRAAAGYDTTSSTTSKLGNVTTVTSDALPSRVGITRKNTNNTGSSEELFLSPPSEDDVAHQQHPTRRFGSHHHQRGGISKTKDVEITFEQTELRELGKVDLEKGLPALPRRSRASSVVDNTWLSDRSESR